MREARGCHAISCPITTCARSLLDFGRIEAGACEYRFAALDPAELAEEVADQFQDEVRDAGYTIQLEASGALPPVRADRDALGRALWNLLDNAVKYSPGCRKVLMKAFCDDGEAVISVHDRGMGIPPDEQRQIFTEFFRGPTAVEAGVGGTGLGLAIVQQTVSAHGGSLHVESHPHEGSTFTIRLPCLRDQL